MVISYRADQRIEGSQLSYEMGNKEVEERNHWKLGKKVIRYLKGKDIVL